VSLDAAGVPPWDPARCSLASRAAGEPAIGTAAVARGFLVLEQAGSWGRAAAVESQLDPLLGKALDTVLSAVGGRFALLRIPGESTGSATGRPRIALVAGGLTTPTPWLLRGTVSDPGELAVLPWEALDDATPGRLRVDAPWLVPTEEPVMLVCTNGRRDRCCAIAGRGVAAEASGDRPGQVYETTHTGGHRFAPTGVLLPFGQGFARLDASLVEAALDAARSGRLAPELMDETHNRGCSALPKPAQAALATVQSRFGVPALAGWEVEATREGDGWTVTLRLGDDTWHTRVTESVDRSASRPVSCGGPPEPVTSWQVELVSADI